MIQVLEDLIEEDDSNPHAWHVLGTAYYAGGMLEEALVSQYISHQALSQSRCEAATEPHDRCRRIHLSCSVRRRYMTKA